MYNQDRSRMSLMFHSDSARLVREKAAHDRSHLVTIAASLVEKKSTDPRDICYAIKAIYPGLLGDIEVRYDRCVADIYTEVAARLIAGILGTG